MNVSVTSNPILPELCTGEICRLICEERRRIEWDEADASHQDSHQGHEEGRHRRIEGFTGRRRRRNWMPVEKGSGRRGECRVGRQA